MMAHTLRRSAGFTLLEIIVALAVLGVGLGVVLQIFSGGLKNIHRIELAHRAMSHGENVMNEILTNQEVTGPTTLSGDLDEDFDYSAEIAEFEDPDQGGFPLELPVEAQSTKLLAVHVRIHFKHDAFGKYYQLRSLKTVSPLNPDGLGLPGQIDPVRQLFGRQQ